MWGSNRVGSALKRISFFKKKFASSQRVSLEISVFGGLRGAYKAFKDFPKLLKTFKRN